MFVAQLWQPVVVVVVRLCRIFCVVVHRFASPVILLNLLIALVPWSPVSFRTTPRAPSRFFSKNSNGLHKISADIRISRIYAERQKFGWFKANAIIMAKIWSTSQVCDFKRHCLWWQTVNSNSNIAYFVKHAKWVYAMQQVSGCTFD